MIIHMYCSTGCAVVIGRCSDHIPRTTLGGNQCGGVIHYLVHYPPVVGARLHHVSRVGSTSEGKESRPAVGIKFVMLE